MKENGFTLKKRQKQTITDAENADDLAIIYLPKPILCYIAWNRQQEALVSMWMQTKRSECDLIRRHLHFKAMFFEIRSQAHVPR